MIISPDSISAAIDTAPAWTTLALHASREALKEDARRELAEHLYRSLVGPVSRHSGQLALPL